LSLNQVRYLISLSTHQIRPRSRAASRFWVDASGAILTALGYQHKAQPQSRLKPFAISVLLLASFGLAVLAIWPELDLAASGLFFSPPRKFAAMTKFAHIFRVFAAIVPFIVFSGAVLGYFAGLAKLLPLHLRLRARSLLFLVATLAVGPGLLVNEGFKAHVHRPRPAHVRDFGGEAPSQPFYRLDGPCAKNCSFPSGETAAAYWLMAPAALAPAPFQAPCLAAAFLFGLLTGGFRMAAGAHFLSDVLFSGWLMGLTIIGLWVLMKPRSSADPNADAGLQEDHATL
jgi:membrane-associated PAP2 superfamily phosphatase